MMILCPYSALPDIFSLKLQIESLNVASEVLTTYYIRAECLATFLINFPYKWLAVKR